MRFHTYKNYLYDFHKEEYEKKINEIKNNFDDADTAQSIFRLLFTYQENGTPGLQKIVASINELITSYFSKIDLEEILPSGIEGLSYVNPDNPNLKYLDDAMYVVMLLASSQLSRKAEPLLNDLIRKYNFHEDPKIYFARAYIYMKRAEDYISNFFDVQHYDIERVTNSEHTTSYKKIFSLKRDASNYDKNRIPAIYKECISLINKAILLDDTKYEYYHFRFIIEDYFYHCIELTWTKKNGKDPDVDSNRIFISDSMLNDLKIAARIKPIPDNWYSYYNLLRAKILNDNDIMFVSLKFSKKYQIKQSDIVKVRETISEINRICASNSDIHIRARMYNLLSFYHRISDNPEFASDDLSKSVLSYDKIRTTWDNLYTMAMSNGRIDLYAPLISKYRSHFNDDRSFFTELLVLELSGKTDKAKLFLLNKPSFEYDNSNNVLILMEIFILIRRIDFGNSKKLIERCRYLLLKYNNDPNNIYIYELYKAILDFLEKNDTYGIIKISNAFPEEIFCEKFILFLKANTK